MQLHDLSRTIIGSDYLMHVSDGKKPPSIDCFLDFINKLKELSQAGECPPNLYVREIEAVKAILTMETRAA